MKKLLFICALTAMAMACQDNLTTGIEVPDDTVYEFNDRFPGVKSVTWEKRGVYRVAVFNYSGMAHSAWFTQDDVWCMTEKRVPVSGVPARVSAAFDQDGREAEYVDLLHRDGIEDIYVAVTPAGDWYYYSEDGLPVKTLAAADNLYGDYRHEIVPPVPARVFSTVTGLYPSARIMEVDVIFPGVIFVEIIDNMVLKTMEFALTGVWAGTRWPVSEQYVRSHAPGVYEAYDSLGYNGACFVECIDCYHTASALYFWFSLDNNGEPGLVKIREDGNIASIS